VQMPGMLAVLVHVNCRDLSTARTSPAEEASCIFRARRGVNELSERGTRQPVCRMKFRPGVCPLAPWRLLKWIPSFPLLRSRFAFLREITVVSRKVMVAPCFGSRGYEMQSLGARLGTSNLKSRPMAACPWPLRVTAVFPEP
jgi:hypothetical protein